MWILQFIYKIFAYIRNYYSLITGPIMFGFLIIHMVEHGVEDHTSYSIQLCAAYGYRFLATFFWFWNGIMDKSAPSTQYMVNGQFFYGTLSVFATTLYQYVRINNREVPPFDLTPLKTIGSMLALTVVANSLGDLQNANEFGPPVTLITHTTIIFGIPMLTLVFLATRYIVIYHPEKPNEIRQRNLLFHAAVICAAQVVYQVMFYIVRELGGTDQNLILQIMNCAIVEGGFGLLLWLRDDLRSFARNKIAQKNDGNTPTAKKSFSFHFGGLKFHSVR